VTKTYEAQKLPIRQKLNYGIGNLVYGVAANAMGYFLFFYFTAVMGLSGTLVGIAAAVSLTTDALFDPLLGSWSDGIRSTWGRRLPFMLVGAPATALGLGLLFSPPHGHGEMITFAWLLATTLALRFSISIFHVPFTAMGAEITHDYAERATVVAYRWIFENIGGLAVVLLGYSVFLAGPKGMMTTTGYSGLGWSGAVIVLAGGLGCALGLRRFVVQTPAAAPHALSFGPRLLAEMKEVFSSQSFRIIFIAMVLLFAGQGVTQALGQHMNNFVWKMTPQQIRSTALGLFGGLLVGAPLAPWVISRLEKRTIFIAGLTFLVLAQTLLATLRAFGILTWTGQAMVAPLVVNAIIAGVGVSFAAVTGGAMMADAADEHDLLFGARREGLYFAGVSFAAKAAYGVGTLVGGVALDAIGFPKHVTPGAALDPNVLARLATVYGPLAGVFSIIGVWLVLFYRIDRARHHEVTTELQARRQAPANAGA